MFATAVRTFRVNDIFYSLQGEGRNTGRAAVFIRFAGCNLRCPFCDTEFDSFREMTDKEIIETIDCILQTTDCRPQTTDYRPQTTDYRLQAIRPLVVLTGGEPTLQVDETFVDLLHQHSYEVAMESNGTRPAPRNLDWLTVSPKIAKSEGQKNRDEKQEVRGEKQEVSDERLPDELKIVFDEGIDPESFLSPLTSHLSPLTSHLSPLTSHHSPLSSQLSPLLYLQPCDTGDAERNAAITKACVAYIKEHPQWRLSLQTHKLIGIE